MLGAPQFKVARAFVAIDFFEKVFHFNHAIDLLGIYCLTISIYDPFSAGATGASGFK
jgi:hypothetical protein